MFVLIITTPLKVAATVFHILLTLSSMVGNSLVIGVVARFRALRTVPNIYTVNLAVVDLLNPVINLPIYSIYAVHRASWFKGHKVAFLGLFINRLFIYLNLASMLSMLVNTYLGISLDLTFIVWKTKKKALAAVVLIWLISIVMTLSSCIDALYADLGDISVSEYRSELLETDSNLGIASIGFFLVMVAASGILTTRSIWRKKKERKEMNLPPLQAEARFVTDIKATKTIAITITAFFICYIPSILYLMLGQHIDGPVNSWFGFMAFSSLYFSSVVNPLIYYVRTRRFRRAIWQFIKNPFGKTAFKEKPEKANIKLKINAVYPEGHFALENVGIQKRERREGPNRKKREDGFRRNETRSLSNGEGSSQKVQEETVYKETPDKKADQTSMVNKSKNETASLPDEELRSQRDSSLK